MDSHFNNIIDDVKPHKVKTILSKSSIVNETNKNNKFDPG